MTIGPTHSVPCGAAETASTGFAPDLDAIPHHKQKTSRQKAQRLPGGLLFVMRGQPRHRSRQPEAVFGQGLTRSGAGRSFAGS